MVGVTNWLEGRVLSKWKQPKGSIENVPTYFSANLVAAADIKYRKQLTPRNLLNSGSTNLELVEPQRQPERSKPIGGSFNSNSMNHGHFENQSTSQI